jgi:hypothetical protein
MPVATLTVEIPILSGNRKRRNYYQLIPVYSKLSGIPPHKTTGP